jgi:hypothetical protein
MNSKAFCTVEKADFRGWQAVYLRNGLVSLAAVPDIGGRLMAYDLGPYAYLFVDPSLAGKVFTPEENQGDGSLAAWKNYGGDKTWPAPQGWDTGDEWHGPPDPVLDTGRYRLEKMEVEAGGATVCMVSPPDPRTGLQITRQATLVAGSTRVNLVLTFTNVSNRPVRWSIWDVAQLRAERRLPGGGLAPETQCTVTTPLNPRSRFGRGYKVMFGEQDNPQWDADPERGLFTGRYCWEIGKVGIDSNGGWAAFSNGGAGYAFAEHFPVSPGGEYPDGGATVEFWTVGKGKVANLDYERSDIYLMEMEILSPLYHFQPGESRSFTIQWGACRCPGPVLAANDAGCTGRSLIAEPERTFVRFTGAFGVYDPGDLSLVWKDCEGMALETIPLGGVHPLEMIILDSLYARPAEAASAELLVTSSFDGTARRLAGVGVQP